MSRCQCGYMTVEVDLNEALEEMTDEMILQEAEDRKLTAGAYGFDPMDDLRMAYRELLVGRSAEALVILERLVMPKWSSARACEMDLKRKIALTSGQRCN